MAPHRSVSDNLIFLHTTSRASRLLRTLSRTSALQKRAQAMTAARMAQLPQGLCFNLPDAFPCHGKILPHFLKRVFAAILQTKTHFHDLFLSWAKRFEHLGSLLTQIQIDDRIRR